MIGSAVLRWTCCLCTVGQVVRTLPEGPPVHGVTSLADEVYVVRWKELDQVEVYDVITYRLQRCLTVPNLRGITDMTSCEHCHSVYIANNVDKCIHRLGVQGAVTRWDVGDKPRGLSVNAAHNLLLTLREVRKIKEFSSRGDLLRELKLPDDVIHPWQAIETRNGQFIVCHGDLGDVVHRVCKVSGDGRHVVHSHGGQRGPGSGQYNVPLRLAVDGNEFVFIADINNGRVTLLSPTLEFIRYVTSLDQLKWHPVRMYLDAQRRRLYVADNEWKDGHYTAGRAVVFSV